MVLILNSSSEHDAQMCSEGGIQTAFVYIDRLVKYQKKKISTTKFYLYTYGMCFELPSNINIKYHELASCVLSPGSDMNINCLLRSESLIRPMVSRQEG